MNNAVSSGLVFTTNPRQAKQFATRKAASAAAVSIRWRRSDVLEISVMGFRLWAIADEHCRLLTQFGYDTLIDGLTDEYKFNFGAK